MEFDGLGPIEEEDHGLLVALQQGGNPGRVVIDHERLECSGDGLEFPVTSRGKLVCETEGVSWHETRRTELFLGVADKERQTTRPGDSAAGASDHHPVVSFHSAPSDVAPPAV